MTGAVETAHAKVVAHVELVTNCPATKVAVTELRRYLAELFFEGVGDVDRLASAGEAYLLRLRRDRTA